MGSISLLKMEESGPYLNVLFEHSLEIDDRVRDMNEMQTCSPI